MAFRIPQANQENTEAKGKDYLPAQLDTGAVMKVRPPLGVIGNHPRYFTGVTKQKAKLDDKPDIRRPPQCLKQQKPTESCVTTETRMTEEAVTEEIDDVGGSPQLCGEYAKEIYSYLHKLEKKFHVLPDYMSRQSEINEKMRRVLVDWLVRVHHSFSLQQETLYLSISIMDRYLAVSSVKRSQLQLVGVTALFIASKYEELFPPEINDYVYITDNAYTAKEVRARELLILKALGYSFGNPLPPHFLRRISRAGNATAEIHTMAKMFLELCLLDYAALSFRPSLQAAAAFFLASKVHSAGDWTPTLKHYSTYSVSELMPCVQSMTRHVRNMHLGKQQAVREKYGRNSFLNVAKDPRLRGTLLTSLLATGAPAAD